VRISDLFKDDPLQKIETAYQDIVEQEYKAEIELTDRYQAFTGELVRLSLAGIAVFGFLFEKVFISSSSDRDLATIIQAKQHASYSIFFFGFCTFFGVAFRYFSTESIRLYIEGLHFKQADHQIEAGRKLKQRRLVVMICIICKFIAALSLAVGSLLAGVAVTEVIK
jgi:exosortase/archaeosortase